MRDYRYIWYCGSIKVDGIKDSIHCMSKGSAMGLDKHLVEFLKNIGKAGLKWVDWSFNTILRTINIYKE